MLPCLWLCQLKTGFFSGKLQEIRRRQAGCYADNKVKIFEGNKLKFNILFHFKYNTLFYYIKKSSTSNHFMFARSWLRRTRNREDDSFPNYSAAKYCPCACTQTEKIIQCVITGDDIQHRLWLKLNLHCKVNITQYKLSETTIDYQRHESGYELRKDYKRRSATYFLGSLVREGKINL